MFAKSVKPSLKLFYISKASQIGHRTDVVGSAQLAGLLLAQRQDMQCRPPSPQCCRVM